MRDRTSDSKSGIAVVVVAVVVMAVEQQQMMMLLLPPPLFLITTTLLLPLGLIQVQYKLWCHYRQLPEAALKW